MKILGLYSAPVVGGPEKSYVIVSEGLRPYGHEAMVACSKTLKPYFEENGVRTFPLWIGPKLSQRNVYQLLLSPFMFCYFLGLFLYMKRKEGIEVIYTAYKKEQIIGGLAARLLGLPVVWREEAALPHPIPQSKFWQFIYRTLTRVTHRVLPSCDIAARSLLDIGVMPEKVTVVYNGVDHAKFSSKKKRPHEPVIGIAARISGFKGHDVLILAMPQILKKFPDARLMIIGDGPAKPGLQHLVSQLKLEDNVEFIGFVNDVENYLDQLSVFVLPSQLEGLPFCVIEAMAMGIPVVATRTGDVPQLVVDGETGLILEQATPETVADAIEEILADRKRSSRMGASGRRRSHELFSIQQMVDGMANVFNEAAAAKN